MRTAIRGRLRRRRRGRSDGGGFGNAPLSANLGRDVVTSAQRHGNLAFKGTEGVTGTLHLKDDSVTLDQ